MMTNADSKSGVLIIDDDDSLLESYTVLLEDEFDVHVALTGEAGLHILQQEAINVLLLDIRLPGMDGFDVLRQAKAMASNLDVIMVSAVKNDAMKAKALQLGAYDYLTKPFEVDTVLSLLRQTSASLFVRPDEVDLEAQLDRYQGGRHIIGRSPQIREVFDLVDRIADTNATVLIHGESGTGKELIARAIHERSRRRSKPFVAVNCSAIAEHLVESELFGHVRGAFTGAVATRLGKFESANSGVLFLDEIANLRLDLQAKLLRVLQQPEFERVGSNRTIHVDVRIIAATNQNLKRMVQNGTFREDLFYRLDVVNLPLPPLRERSTDIPLLVDHFLDKYNQAYERHLEGFTPAALDTLRHYPWPGNVRELENVIERLTALHTQGILGVEDLPLDLRMAAYDTRNGLAAGGHDLRKARAAFERRHILNVLKTSDWNQTRAAQRLGIHRNTLLEKMDKLRIRSLLTQRSPEIDGDAPRQPPDTDEPRSPQVP